MRSTDLTRGRDRYLRAATVVSALLATLTVSTTAVAAALLGAASPDQAAVQPGLHRTHAPQQFDAATASR
jgi:hypothetical protein